MRSRLCYTTAMQLLRSVRGLWAKPLVRKCVVIGILLITTATFIRFFTTHPQYWEQLKEVSPSVILTVLAFNAVLIFILAAIYRLCVLLCGKQIEPRENFLLTAYSSIINFFGPLQSGPGVRAVYLKTRLQVRLRDYTFVTLLYYGIFAVINIGFLLAGTRPWWQTAVALLAACSFSAFIVNRFQKRDKKPGESQLTLEAKLLVALVLFTFMQIFVLCLVYYTELQAVNASISFRQAISYTGAANLALFVSLTPGAIGFRESFLYFSQSLHHVSTANILSANLIDRAVYVIFLLLLLIVVLAMHAGKKLRLRDLQRSAAKSSTEQL
jgi:uncharacterized membrane protein YbhN (UPF0104 family)